jgi:hypothetical protein
VRETLSTVAEAMGRVADAVLVSLAAVVSIAAVVSLTAGVFAFAPSEAAAHGDPCHRARTCPSDHAKYRWHGLLCVSPKARERSASFRLMYVHATYVYFCKR